MSYSLLIKEKIERFFETDDWHYTFNEEKGFFKAGVNLKGKIAETQLIIRLYKDHYIVYANIALRADEECRARVADYLTRANYGLKWGNFELDMRDGEIRYKCLVDCGDDNDCLPSPSVIKNSIYLPPQMIRKYGDGLLAVMCGFKTPEEAVKEAES